MINIKEFNNQKTQISSLCKISKCVVPDWRPVRHPDKSLPVFTMINLAWNIVSYWWMVGIIMPGGCTPSAWWAGGGVIWMTQDQGALDNQKTQTISL